MFNICTDTFISEQMCILLLHWRKQGPKYTPPELWALMYGRAYVHTCVPTRHASVAAFVWASVIFQSSHFGPVFLTLASHLLHDIS